MVLDFNSRRSPTVARHGMVAASQPLAAMAGMQILQQGGNAADAAIATAAALNVTEPTSTGLGGDCFALFYDAKRHAVSALNGSGRAPAALTLALLEEQGIRDVLPQFHPFTITVPGACAGWCDLLTRHGTLSLRHVLAPAIKLAEDGFPVAPVTAHYWNKGVEKQLGSALGGRALMIDGRAPRPGEIFRNQDLANTLRVISEGGTEAYYRGDIARKIASIVQQAGGVMTEQDLAAHTSTWETPLSTTYRDVRVWECPPNGQGLAALMALNLLKGFDVSRQDFQSADRWHMLIEAMRVAFADTSWYVADPTVSQIPLDALLSDRYAAERRALIQMDRATVETQRGAPVGASDTVYFCVVDEQGNACSFTNSNYNGFGTGIVPDGCGFTLQNRGANFSLDPQHPNVLAPSKRPYHTIIPGMLTKIDDDSWVAPFGVMGGFMQPQGHVQVVVGMVDDHLDPQAALDRPRFCISPATAAGAVSLEVGVKAEVVAELTRRGHAIEPDVSGYERSMFGRGQIIRRELDGVLWGGSDPRADGCAIGY